MCWLLPQVWLALPPARCCWLRLPAPQTKPGKTTAAALGAGTYPLAALGNGATPDKRAAVFGALPGGNKAMLLLKDADHMTFGGVTGRAAGILPREAVTTQL